MQVTILTKREVWKRDQPPHTRAFGSSIARLSPAQSANVRRSLDLVRMQRANGKGVARAIGVD